jgi:rhodanese-related sulfurtransferase
MRMKIFLIVALLLTSVSAWAQSSNFTDLTAEEVKQRIDQPGKVLLVDARTAKEYKMAHIPTAINIPPAQIKSVPNHLPLDKAMPIIFYCRGYS